MKPALLITGGAGYIGSQTCKVLARAGYIPVTYDNLSRGNRWAVKWGPFEYGDLGDRHALRSVMTKYDIRAVLHFAGYAYVDESVVYPEMYFQNNVTKSLVLFECMKEYGIADVIFSSSCATYGIPTEIPIKECHPQNPISPYGASKKAIEAALRGYEQAGNLRWVALRYFNAAGADLEGEVGEAHQPETHLIPRCIEAGLGLRRKISISGTDYLTPDGTAVRDYVHVHDLANAHICALRYLSNGGESRAFNVGIGRGYSVREVVNTVEKQMNVTSLSHMAGRRAGDPAKLIADATAARDILEWKPQHSELGEIIRTAVNWHTEKGAVKILNDRSQVLGITKARTHWVQTKAADE